MDGACGFIEGERSPNEINTLNSGYLATFDGGIRAAGYHELEREKRESLHAVLWGDLPAGAPKIIILRRVVLCV